jgi:hypothetical protein
MRNEFWDPGFESGALPFMTTATRAANRTLAAGANDTSRIVTDSVATSDAAYGPVIRGNYSLRVSQGTNTVLINEHAVAYRWELPAEMGQVWSFGAWAAYASANYEPFIRFQFLDAAKADVTASVQVDGGLNVKDPKQLTILDRTAPLGTAWVRGRVGVIVRAANAVGAVYFDDIMLAQGSTLFPTPVSGDRGLMSWEGEPFASASVCVDEPETLAEYKSWTPSYMWADPISAENP